MTGMTLRAALCAAALCTAVSTAAETAFADRAALEALNGTWASASPEPWYGGHGTRRFTFADGQWSLVFTHALDPAMAQRTFASRTHGPYLVGVASPAVPGAFEAVFFEDRKLVTLLTDDPRIVAAFGFEGCGLRLHVEVDISATGCANWKPVALCREDHDLLAQDARGLHFGVRPRDNDMCTADRRPAALLPPVVRQ
jgi:hypothetical protein